MENLFKNKKILVTGGTGSIGSEIVRHLLKFAPAVIRIFDIDEEGQFYFTNELTAYSNARFLIGDVRNKERLRLAMRDIDIVFHAAALKHVPLCEYNPFEAIETNILGTQNVISAAIEQNVRNVIVISSDKATEPINVMGATKLLAERLVVGASAYSHGKTGPLLSCVRFGNVINSRGSIVPLVIRQIQKGGPVTITDPGMSRFIMSIQEAVRLLFSTLELMQGGEVFILKMSAFRVIELIEVLIEELAPKFGFKKQEILIKHIGRRSGERNHEILMTEIESETALELKDMYILIPTAEFPFLGVKYIYKGAKPLVRKHAIVSRDINQISKAELKKILLKEKIL